MKNTRQKISFFVVLMAAVLSIRSAGAVLEIDITQGVAAGIPIAVVPFEYRGSDPPPHEVSKVVGSDLRRSGRFETIAHENFLNRPHDHTEVEFKDWRLIKAEVLVVGRVIRMALDQYRVEFRLFDVFKEQQLGGFRYDVSGNKLRKIAHQIADFIYLRLIGERGAFDTRIAYVTLQVIDGERNYLLRVADSDGYNPRTILKSDEPILSPSWSPDGEKLSYVSFEKKRSMVYVQRLKDASRELVASHDGINGAPAWSPNGRTLAFTSSKDGNPEIYLFDTQTRLITRVTQHHGIDTEAAWSPNGQHLVFTSDRSGRPQIYRIRRNGTGLERLTFEGKYNARAFYDPNGERLTLVTNQGNGYRIGVFYLDSRGLHVLTDTTLDESPSFAPNGAMILYATQQGGRGVLAAVSSDGRVKQTLRFQKGDVREPAWSPYNQKL
ncbi:MAG: Protein TolB [Gammaproteobacteria bacterium]|nr:Protein TolB [Gammaproteobacteria bacterium]